MLKKTSKLVNLRITWLRMICNIALLLLIAGCGGGGGSSAPDNPVVRVLSETIDPTIGGTIVDSVTGLKFTYPPNTDVTVGPQAIQILIHERQADGAVPVGFDTTSFGIEIQLRPDMISQSNPPTILISSHQTFDALRTGCFFRDGSGQMFPLKVAGTGIPSQSLVTLSAAAFRAHGNITRPNISAGISGWIVSSSGHQHSFIPPTGQFFLYVPVVGQRGSWVPETGKMPGKRIAIVVHGLGNNVNNMTDLARFLGRDLNSSVQSPVYDQVWGYQYNWLAHIDDSGRQFADDLKRAMDPDSEIDIYAHSMGGLVSRWALEKEGMGQSIHRLVTIDTPHEGVPLGIVQLLVNYLANSGDIPIQGFIPGVEDLVEPLWDPFHNTFLDHLNAGDSPYKSTANYYSTAGTRFDNYSPFGVAFGYIVDGFYNPPFVSHAIDHDGIVPVYSANSSVLTHKSDSYAQLGSHTIIFDLNHAEAVGDKSDFTEPCVLGSARVQCVVENGLKDFIIGTLNGGVH
ncbi:MAG: hypothetical protein JST12_07095 [Armatimonadetes bacterium]|nr:hypothetical protein [Armatimonadota bacterium]